MTAMTPTRSSIVSSTRAPLPYLMSWLDSLWPAEVDLALRSTHGIRVEEFSRNGDFVLRAELPGVDIDKDVDVTVGDGVLTIDATREQLTEEERRTEFNYGRFHRSILLPPGVDDDAISATYEDGILEVTVHMPVQATERLAVPISRNQ
jgi:HSP20 family protein